MRSDFIDYNPEIEDMIHCITAGNEKDSDGTPLILSTWQSIYQQPVEWFNQFDVVIGDECHQYKATSLVAIMEKCKMSNGGSARQERFLIRIQLLILLL